jgi:hypothetical protein
VLVWLAVLMTVLSLSPAAAELVAAQGQHQTQPESERAQDPNTTSLEVHVVECPPGTTGTGLELFDACHANGLEGVNVQVTSTDAALGIDQPKTTTRINDAGPGIINTGDIPVGEYQVTVDLPSDANAFSIYCSGATSDQEYPVTPNNAAQATLTLPGDEGVVCDWYVIPGATSGLAKIDVTMYTCNEAAFDGAAGRAYEDLAAACPDTAARVDLSLAAVATGEETTTPIDAQGKASFPDLQPGDYTLNSDVPDENVDEFLFCVADGGDRYEKDFNENGVTTYQDVTTEQLACDWYVVSTAAPAATTTVTPTETLTQAPPTAAPAEAPSDAAQVQQLQAAGAIDVTLFSCPQDYDVSANGETHSAFGANCTGPVADVAMTLTDTANGNTNQQVSDANGAVAYPNLPPGTYTLYSGIPLEAATEYVFCTSEGLDYQKDLSDRGVTTFTGLESEQIACDWYVVPLDLRGEENGGSLTVHLAACPVEYTGDQIFDDCHARGVAGMQYTLNGPGGEQTATTEIPQTPGPGITTFTALGAGDYTLAGGPPGDFGSVRLYCSDQATNQQIDASIDSTIATFSIGDNQDVLCDWYYVPENASGITPTPTPTETPRAEILVTLYACAPTDAESGYAGATYGQLADACQDPVNDVSFTLGDVGAPPLSAATGVSGAGAVRFFDLLPADYTLTPSLPGELTSAAVYCRIGDGDAYQKTLQSGAATFVDVAGEQIACDWFAVPVREPQPSGPTGSITVRELLCQADRSEIQDWEQECTPGTTGTSFSLASSDGAITQQAAPNAEGVLVFSALPDGYYELKQDEGVWCRAAAERVDSRSRVIVRDGGNTDVFLYQCGQVNTLPSTGAGTGQAVDGAGGGDLTATTIAALMLAVLAAPLFAAGVMQSRRPAAQRVPVEDPRPAAPERTISGTHWMRFR